MCLLHFTYRLFSLRRTSWWECVKGGLLAGSSGKSAAIAHGVLASRWLDAYGVIGSFIAMMMWFYYAWTVLFFGAEFVQVTHRIRVARQAARTAVATTTQPTATK